MIIVILEIYEHYIIDRKRGDIKMFQMIQKEKVESAKFTPEKNEFGRSFQKKSSAEAFLKSNQPNIFTSASHTEDNKHRLLQKDKRIIKQRKQNTSNFSQNGLPEQLKNNIENMSGYGMENVRVHYNSSKPAQLQALAYTQGLDIHIAPGQEKHLPHEAWHVVQQMQGRVHPTIQMHNALINDNPMLEQEADRMGEKAIQGKFINCPITEKPLNYLYIQKKAKTYYNTYVLNVDNNGNITNGEAVRIAPPVSTFANKLTGKVYTGGHLMKREYGGLDNFQNVVPWSAEVEENYTTNFENRYENDLQQNYKNKSCNFNAKVVYGNIINANNHEIKKMGKRLKHKGISVASDIEIIEELLNYFPKEVKVSVGSSHFEKTGSTNFGFDIMKKEDVEAIISQFSNTDFNNIRDSFRT